MWQRRAFLRAAGLGFAAGLLPRQALALERNELVFASAVQTAGGGYGAVLLGERGDVIATIDLPDRGHDITISREAGRGVVFARQSGRRILQKRAERHGGFSGRVRSSASGSVRQGRSGETSLGGERKMEVRVLYGNHKSSVAVHTD